MLLIREHEKTGMQDETAEEQQTSSGEEGA